MYVSSVTFFIRFSGSQSILQSFQSWVPWGIVGYLLFEAGWEAVESRPCLEDRKSSLLMYYISNEM